MKLSKPASSSRGGGAKMVDGGGSDSTGLDGVGSFVGLDDDVASLVHGDIRVVERNGSDSLPSSLGDSNFVSSRGGGDVGGRSGLNQGRCGRSGGSSDGGAGSLSDELVE